MGGLSHTVSGDIASFRTPSKVPIESLKFHFLPKQEGSGDPSPTNIRPITGWTGLNGRQEGKNLIDKTALTGTDSVWWNGRVVTGYPNHCVTPLIPVKPGASYYLYRISTNDSGGSGQNYVAYFGQDGTTYIKQQNWSGTSGTGGIYTIPEDVYYIGITIGTSHKDTAILCPSSLSTDYVNYISPRLFPVTFPDSQTIYGGYYDPVVGEIVEEWGYHVFDGTEEEIRVNYRTTSRDQALMLYPKGGILPLNSSGDTICNILKTTNNQHGANVTYARPSSSGLILDFARETICNLTSEEFQALTDAQMVTIVKDYLAGLYENGTPMISYYKLATPIHIHIAPQDIQAFLDHNNFWSDANDITEVTYAVTESKDILATRKKAMDFDHAHHKKVKWNQLSLDGNFQDSEDWLATKDYGSISFSNGTATWTALQPPVQYYQTGFTRKKNYLAIPYNHKIFVCAKMKTSGEYNYSNAGLMFNIYGMVTSSGGAHTYYYREYVTSNDWQYVRGFLRDRPAEPPSGFDDVIIKKFKTLLSKINANVSWEDVIDTGDTLEVKNLMAFDLTQMFGLGNEPQTVAEFEHICEINGIDLTTYQPYDEGSDRWLIVP